MRISAILFPILVGATSPAFAQIGVEIGLPSISIGIDIPVYPELVLVPGYPVYYAPSINANMFFYDGMFWNLSGDNWYSSGWYNGPWLQAGPEFVPLFVLRVPVSYYRSPPAYFVSWQADAPPRWGDHWGVSWQQNRPGWDQWNHAIVVAPAPLPTYQRQYSGASYPTVAVQITLQTKNYHYQPRDAVVQKQAQAQYGTRPSAAAAHAQGPAAAKSPAHSEAAQPASASAHPVAAKKTPEPAQPVAHEQPAAAAKPPVVNEAAHATAPKAAVPKVVAQDLPQKAPVEKQAVHEAPAKAPVPKVATQEVQQKAPVTRVAAHEEPVPAKAEVKEAPPAKAEVKEAPPAKAEVKEAPPAKADAKDPDH
jgi:hypothetical protein